MIKLLKLENFQKHAILELTFKDGLNIIYGHTDSGKSSIVRALRWILFDDFSSNEARKQGTKQTVVTVIFDNGIEVSRIKSNSINAYELKQGTEVKRYDAIGKGIPEDVQKIFGMELFEVDGLKINLNIAEQLSAPFLLGKEYPSTFRAKLFNQLTGNDLQDKVFKDLNKELLGFAREITSLEKQVEEHLKELEVVDIERDKVSLQYENANNTFLFIEDLEVKKQSYLSLFKRLTTNKEAKLLIESGLKRVKTIDQPLLDVLKDKILRLDALKQRLAGLKRTQNDLTNVQSRISQIKTPDLHFGQMYDILNRVNKLKELFTCFNSNNEKSRQINQNLEALSIEMNNNELRLKDLKTNFMTCPLCDKIIANKDIQQLRSLK